jgi:uncharacterized membrane protein YhaH (DUF805 family)
MKWYLKVIKNYVGFSGRARRKEYWMFALFNLIFIAVAAILDNILGTTFKIGAEAHSVSLPYGYLYVLYALAVFIPGVAVGFRRLHDVGKSGWFFLIALIPIVGAIWLLVLFCQDSNVGENIYGTNPKEIA